jgi:hypothetical protein
LKAVAVTAPGSATFPELYGFCVAGASFCTMNGSFHVEKWTILKVRNKTNCLFEENGRSPLLVWAHQAKRPGMVVLKIETVRSTKESEVLLNRRESEQQKHADKRIHIEQYQTFWVSYGRAGRTSI